MRRPIGWLLFAPLVAAPADAQLMSGKWTGRLVLDAGGAFSVEMSVRHDGDSLLATMNAIDGPVSPVVGLDTAEDGVVFLWGDFGCSLLRIGEDGLTGMCATTDGATGQLTLAIPETRVGADVLTTRDLVDTQATTVYDALERIRPYWIRPRGQGRIGYSTVVQVYIERQRMGDVNLLHTIEPTDIEELRFYPPSEATMLFGTNNEGGVIAIVRRRG